MNRIHDPIRAFARRPALAYGAAALLLLTVLPLTLAQVTGPEPSRSATLWYVPGQAFFTQPWNLTTNATYDLTFANLSGTNGTSLNATIFTLHRHDGSQADVPRMASPSGAGTYNVTFPGATLDSPGNWSLRGQGFPTTYFRVDSAQAFPTLLVSHSPAHPLPGSSVTIHVESSAGGPVAGASLSFIGPYTPTNATTDANGDYVLQVRYEGNYTVYASKSGYMGGRDEFTAAYRGDLRVSHAPESPTNGSIVTIRVTIGNATPAAGAHVAIHRDGALVENGTADGNGTYAFVALHGNHLVNATLPGYRPGMDYFHVYPSTLPPPTARPVFSIDDVRVGPLGSGVAPIRLQNVSDFGAATLTLTFDPRVVALDNVSGGDIPGSRTTWTVNNTAGKATVLVTTSARPGATGTYVFAHVTLRSVSPAGGSSPLNLTVREALHSDGRDMMAIAVGGTFHASILGDANGDGVLSWLDVDLMSGYVVGAFSGDRLNLRNADVTRDGLVTTRDVLYLGQHLDGTRPEL